MKLNIFIFLLVLTSLPGFSVSIKAQDISEFYYGIRQADLLYEKGKPEEACSLYQNTFEKVDFVHNRVLTKVLKVAKKANNKALMNLCKTRLKLQKNCPSENKVLLAEVDSLFEWDQKVRVSKYWEATQFVRENSSNKEVNNTEEFHKAKKLYDFWVEVDSLNITFLLKLIAKHGYLGEERLGAVNYIKFQTILLHYDKDVNNTILKPILDEALRKNLLTPFTYSQIIDRHLYYNSGTQKFWTWFMIDSDPELTVEEIDVALKLRESTGMWGTEYKVSYDREAWMLNNLSRYTY